MKTIVASAAIALSVSAGVLIASSGGVDDSGKIQPMTEHSASMASEKSHSSVDSSDNKMQPTSSDSEVVTLEGHDDSLDHSDKILPASSSKADTMAVDLSSCKLQKTVSISYALEEVAIDSHEPGGLDKDDDINRDGLDDEYNYVAAYLSEDQSNAIRTSILDGSFMKDSKGVLVGIDINPMQKVTVCDDDIDAD